MSWVEGLKSVSGVLGNYLMAPWNTLNNIAGIAGNTVTSVANTAGNTVSNVTGTAGSTLSSISSSLSLPLILLGIAALIVVFFIYIKK
jgi:hypothetical protein